MRPAKIRYLFTAILVLNALLIKAQNHYALHITGVDKDSAAIHRIVAPPALFASREACQIYIDQLPAVLQAQGYITASIDSVQMDSAQARIDLFVGKIYKWAALDVNDSARQWLQKIGWTPGQFAAASYNPDQIANLQQKMLHYMEQTGHPFARIYMDHMQINGDEVSGRINVEPGPLYHIDSIKITGNARISNEYLQQFLDLKNGDIYNKDKLQQISTELRKLNYVEEQFPPQFIWGTGGGTVELFLNQKKSSQVNVIIGFLPNSDGAANQKMLITGEGLLDLKNAFGSGERIGLVWQRLQAASQRLQISFDQPYLFHTPFGLDLGFDMLKRDSAFVNLAIRVGTQMALNKQQRVKLYVQRFSSILNDINEASILATRRLPEDGDVSITNLGAEYQLNTTDYIFNPVQGFDLWFNTAVGNKKIKPNNEILDLKDPQDPDFDFGRLYDTVTAQSYQWRAVLEAAKYFPLGRARRSTLKTALHGGYISGTQLFRNELFQIGGYRLLRGFDEQSQYLSQYGIATLEYRYLVGTNSYFNVFTDGGWGTNTSRGHDAQYTYLSAGLGLAFETKVGRFNLAWAVGKRNDSAFNLRQSKIHFGFINYF